MDADWMMVMGYTGKCGEDGFPSPGDLIKQIRTKKNMSQEQLALELDCSRAMVTRMEKENLGLNDITTRRQLSKILGIAPMLLGLVTHEELIKTRPTVLYDTTLLKRSLILHREVYFSGGEIGGIPEVDTTVQHIYDISKSLDHKNKDILTILCHYGQLGVDMGREEQNYKATERYGNWSVSIARKLDDHSLLAAAFLRYSAAMYEKGDIARAKHYADEALAQTHVSSNLHAGAILEASRVYARLEDPTTMKLLDKATSIARKGIVDDDQGFVKLTPGFCHLRTAIAFYEFKNYEAALEALDLAEQQTAPNLARRKCAIQVLQSQVLLGQKQFYGATLSASTALSLACVIKSGPNLSNIKGIYQKLKESPQGSSKEVIKLGKMLTQVLEKKKPSVPA